MANPYLQKEFFSIPTIAKLSRTYFTLYTFSCAGKFLIRCVNAYVKTCSTRNGYVTLPPENVSLAE